MPWVWPAGPEGHAAPNKDYVNVGDLIQYDWEIADGSWDHSVIIVQTDDMGYGDLRHMVASHTPDLWLAPYELLTLDPNPGAYRFIHIDCVDPVDVYIPYVSNDYSVVTNSVIASGDVFVPNPYPEPGENLLQQTVSTYPAPGKSVDLYPAPLTP